MNTSTLSVLFAFLIPAPLALAALAPKSDENLQISSTHIVKGSVVEVSSVVKKSKHERAFGVHTDRVYTIKIRVAEIEKGPGIKKDEVIEVTAWHPQARIPPLPGLQGNEVIPEEGDSITAYLIKEPAEFRILIPNGVKIHDE